MKRIRSLQKSPSPQPETLAQLTQDILTAQASVDRKVRDEKLSVQKGCARLLSSIIQDTKTNKLEIDWDDYLPTFNSNDNLELERPLLSNADKEIFARHNQSVVGLGEGELPQGLRRSADIAMAKVKNEKLQCSKESLRQLQETTRSTRFSLQELREFWDTVRIEIEPTKLMYTPLVISTADDTLFADIPPVSQKLFSPVSDKADICVSKTPRIETRLSSSQPSPRGSVGPILQKHHMGDDTRIPHCEERPSANGSMAVGLSISPLSNGEHCHDGHGLQVFGSQGHSQGKDGNLVSPNGRACTPLLESQDSGTMTNISRQPDAVYSIQFVSDPNVTLYPTNAPRREMSMSQMSNTTSSEKGTTRAIQLKRRRSMRGNHAKRPKLHPVRALYTQKPTTSLFTTLGSLSTFMETRSRAKRSILKSVYFSNKSNDISQVQEDPVMESTSALQEPFNESSDRQSTLSNQLTAHVPQCNSHHHAPPILFLSTALLKSHLRLVQSLERAEEHPCIIYRDYDDSSHERTKAAPTQANKSNPPKEADIIISPTTSIILTTSQATTQRYLPGHRLHPHITTTTSSSSNNNNNIIKEIINSPLREQIFLLAPRYEHIYVLIAHTTPPAPPDTGPNHNHQPWTADEQILSNLASLAAFCASLAPHTTVQPLIIPSETETVARWVLALAKKHAIVLPGDSQALDSVEETSWEVFLRRVGLNPYAAEALLNLLKGDAGPSGDGDLSGILEMSEQNRRALGALIGDRAIGRLVGILEKDWQCDWALNFGDSQN